MFILLGCSRMGWDWTWYVLLLTYGRFSAEFSPSTELASSPITENPTPPRRVRHFHRMGAGAGAGQNNRRVIQVLGGHSRGVRIADVRINISIHI